MISYTSVHSASVFIFQDVGGRQFISVLDLEEIIQHEDLLQHPIPEVQDIPSLPTSAQLHVLATSVLRGAAEPQPSVAVQENTIKPTNSTGYFRHLLERFHSYSLMQHLC